MFVVGVPSYEIIWKDTENYFKELIPDEEELGTDLDKLWSTIEPQELVEKTYPELVDAYKQTKIKPKKPSKRKKKAADPVEEIEGMLKNTSITEKKPKRVRKNLKTDKENKPTKKLDSYFKKALVNNVVEKQSVLQESENVATSTPSKKRENSKCLDFSGFEDENITDLSDIVQDIINQEPPMYLLKNLEKCGYKLLQNENDKYENKEIHQNVSASSFFMIDPLENDLFEKTFNEMCDKVNNDSGESTEEYDVDEIVLEECKKTEIDEECDDSFYISDVPLIDRIRSKS